MEIDDIELSRLGDEFLKFDFTDVLDGWSTLLDAIHEGFHVHAFHALGALFPHVLELIDFVANGIDMVAGRNDE